MSPIFFINIEVELTLVCIVYNFSLQDFLVTKKIKVTLD